MLYTSESKEIVYRDKGIIVTYREGQFENGHIKVPAMILGSKQDISRLIVILKSVLSDHSSEIQEGY
jgi:hypothetical protein